MIEFRGRIHLLIVETLVKVCNYFNAPSQLFSYLKSKSVRVFTIQLVRTACVSGRVKLNLVKCLRKNHPPDADDSDLFQHLINLQI